MVSTLEKGNKLEDKFYNYLLAQQKLGDLVFDLYSPELCKIFRKKKYYSQTSEDYIEFDVVIELCRKESKSPHLYIVFECKNHQRNVEKILVNHFLSNLASTFGHAAKGVMVVSSSLQSGAAAVAKNNKLGIVKYDKDGFDIVADRTGNLCAEKRFVKAQIFKDESPVNSLRFSAYHDGKFFGSINHFLSHFASSLSANNEYEKGNVNVSVPFISKERIRQSAQEILKQIDYSAGSVDLEKICSKLSIDLQYTNQAVQDGNGNLILGSANFDRKSILVNFHDNKQRERFTIAHEIGHFCLQHDRYLRSATLVEKDLLINNEKENGFNYEGLEFQANTFASELLLPNDIFEVATKVGRERLGIINRKFGYIFVDDQRCNYLPYNQLLIDLSSYFDVSKQAIEIKFKKMGMLTDERKAQGNWISLI